MTTEELLKPRWKVIADFPTNNYKIGEVYTVPNEVMMCYTIEPYNIDWLLFPEMYPAIFKKLEWWEERSIEDLPEYVKNTDGVYKTYFSIPSKVGSLWEWQIVHPTKEFGAEVMYIIDNKMEPSTKEEYEKTN